MEGGNHQEHCNKKYSLPRWLNHRRRGFHCKFSINGNREEKGQFLDVGGGCDCVARGDGEVRGGLEAEISAYFTEAISRERQRASSLA